MPLITFRTLFSRRKTTPPIQAPLPADGRASSGPAAGVATPRVFVSHSSADNSVAQALVGHLRKKLGEDVVWMDSDGGLEGGDNWFRKINTELASRSVVVVLLSPDAVSSPWVRYEIDQAWVQNKVIIPVVLHTCDIPQEFRIIQLVRCLPPHNYKQVVPELVRLIQSGKTPQLEIYELVASSSGPPFDAFEKPSVFEGRATDVKWVLDRLRQRPAPATAIIAFNGMGGIGKTALAAVTVHLLRAQGRFADGMIFISCQGRYEAGEARDTLVEVLVRFGGPRVALEVAPQSTLAETARQLLGGKDALVVLDNVEPGWPVDDVVRPLCDAGATVLLTARQRLGDVVPAADTRRLDLLSADDALKVFARSYGRGSANELTAAEQVLATRIVKALDRHTLAVKLAGRYAHDAGRDLSALAAELEHPQRALDLPGGKDGEVPAEVRRVFTESYKALSAEGKLLFAALAAFGTPEFGRPAAVALARALQQAEPAASPAPSPATTVDLLVRRALAEAVNNDQMPEGSDRERLHLHPLLRGFAQEQFDKWPDHNREIARQAIASYYVEYVATAADAAKGIDESNITYALDLAHAHGADEDDRVVVALCMGMHQYWQEGGRTEEVASNALPTSSPNAVRYLPWGMEAAKRLTQRWQDAEFRQQSAELQFALGLALQSRGRRDDAEYAFGRVRDLWHRYGQWDEEGKALTALGQLALTYDSLELRRRVESSHNITASLLELGCLLIEERGEQQEGCRLLEEAVKLCAAMQLAREQEAREVLRQVGCHAGHDRQDG